MGQFPCTERRSEDFSIIAESSCWQFSQRELWLNPGPWSGHDLNAGSLCSVSPAAAPAPRRSGAGGAWRSLWDHRAAGGRAAGARLPAPAWLPCHPLVLGTPQTFITPSGDFGSLRSSVPLPRLPPHEKPTLPICPSGRLWASLGLGFPTLRAGGSRRGDVGAQAGLWTWDLHQPRGQKRRSSRPRRRRAADAGGMAGARRRPGRPRSGGTSGRRSPARLRLPCDLGPRYRAAPGAGGRCDSRALAPSPLPTPRSSRAAEPSLRRALPAGAVSQGRRRPSRPRAPRARVPGAAGPELPEASAPPPPALARGSPGRTGPRPAPPDPRGRCTGYMGRDGGRSRAGPAVIWVGVGPGPAAAGTEGQGQRGCWGSAGS